MRRQSLALIAFAAMVVLAGCGGGATTSTATPTQTETEMQTPTATETVTVTETATTTPTPTETGDGSPAVTSAVLSAMQNVEAYHIDSNTTIVQSANNRQRTQRIIAEGMFDRAARELEVHNEIHVAGLTQNTSVFFVDGTLYEHNPRYTSRYGSAWVKVNASDAFFSQQDTLTRQRAFLANATVTVAGTELIEGNEVRVLNADVDEAATREAIMARLGSTGGQVNVTSVTQRLWVDTETNRPVRTTLSMNATITAQGQTVDMTMDVRLSFDYDSSVSIELPSEAQAAVSIGNSTDGS
ncbi:MAG: DUF6612 family protein [Halorhabdus sp.]